MMYGTDVYEYAEDVLRHHGVKGQKWGIRHGPPYPLEEGQRREKKPQKEGLRAGSSDMDHTKSNKSPLAIYLTRTVAHLMMGNVIGVGFDTARLGQAIIAAHKDKLSDKRIAQLETDEKTGLKKKNREFTEDEDMAEVNPNYRNFDGNTKHNCMLCTTAYEMRRRGFDVKAGKASYGYQYEDVTKWFPGSKIEPLSTEAGPANYVKARQGVNYALAKEVTTKLASQGDGARGNLMVQWDLVGSGHSVVYEVKGENVILRDCQTNKLYRNPSRMLRNCVSASCARTDNVEPDYKKIKEVLG